jgi:hypothetical protein
VSKLSLPDKTFLESVLGMSGGYVLDFTNTSLAQLPTARRISAKAERDCCPVARPSSNSVLGRPTRSSFRKQPPSPGLTSGNNCGELAGLISTPLNYVLGHAIALGAVPAGLAAVATTAHRAPAPLAGARAVEEQERAAIRARRSCR